MVIWTKDPDFTLWMEVQVLQKFSVATTESYKDKQGNTQSETEWHSVVAWSSLAEVAGKYLHKGTKIYLEGKIKTRSYEDKEGNKKYVTEIMQTVLSC